MTSHAMVGNMALMEAPLPARAEPRAAVEGLHLDCSSVQKRRKQCLVAKEQGSLKPHGWPQIKALIKNIMTPFVKHVNEVISEAVNPLIFQEGECN